MGQTTMHHLHLPLLGALMEIPVMTLMKIDYATLSAEADSSSTTQLLFI
jgi:hypothetical protein